MGKKILDPIVFHPIYKQLIWGGNKIARFKHTDIKIDNVGESWELSAVPGNESVVSDCKGLEGRTITDLIAEYGASLLGTRVYQNGQNSFPLLIKFIDAQRDLSVQVHPNDQLARLRHNSPGKTEMWYLLEAENDAKIHCGWSASLTPDSYRQCILDCNIMDYVASYNSVAGQFYFVKAGTIHAIGSGNLVAEIQQTSDVTYRVYDYGRLGIDGKPRQLHTELACDALDYNYPSKLEPIAKTVTETRAGVVKSDYFSVDFIKLADDSKYSVNHNGESFRILIVTKGNLSIEWENAVHDYPQGVTILIPACIQRFFIKGNGEALLVSC